jgi:hypothetical protein
MPKARKVRSSFKRGGKLRDKAGARRPAAKRGGTRS